MRRCVGSSIIWAECGRKCCVFVRNRRIHKEIPRININQGCLDENHEQHAQPFRYLNRPVTGQGPPADYEDLI